MAANVCVIILPLQWVLRSSSKLILKMNGENCNSSQETGFHTFAKSTRKISHLFMLWQLPLILVTIWSLKSIRARLRARISQWKGRQWLMKATAGEVASCFLSSSLLFHKGLKRFYQINTIRRAAKKAKASVSRAVLLGRLFPVTDSCTNSR